MLENGRRLDKPLNAACSDAMYVAMYVCMYLACTMLVTVIINTIWTSAGIVLLYTRPL